VTPTDTNTFGPPRPTPAWLGWSALVVFLFTQAYAVVTSPADVMMGHLQKILYVHVPSAWATFAAFGVVLVGSVRFLWKEDERADLLAAASAEVGAMFCGLTLVQGMLWGRPTWGVWWSWDARLTSTLVLFLIFVGYIALRSFVEDPHRRGQWSAAVGILGAINVPIVWMSVRWWRTLHQIQSDPRGVSPVYLRGWLLNVAAFSLIALWFIWKRYEAARYERAAEHAAQAAALGGSNG
jgi:heme exporter protein C